MSGNNLKNMKTRKMKIGALIILSMLVSGLVRAQQDNKEDNKQRMSIPLGDPAKPFKLIAGIVYGSIKVVGYDGKDIEVEVDAEKNKQGDHESPSGMRRIGGSGGAEVSAEQDNNTVKVDGGSSRFHLITIRVPQTGGDMKLKAVNDGEITVENVKGQLEIANVNGGIHVDGAAGSVVANTVNGDVIVTFRSVNPEAAMAFSSLNGNVDVSFPAVFKANMKLKSERGNVFTDFDFEASQTQPQVHKTVEGHMQRISIDDWVFGKINGGGPEVMMKTMNGNVYVRRAK
jgi:DUF4097 and DUF4098 domain-containing protein YvlB